MDGIHETRREPASGTRGWYRPLVGLYGIALILSNPLIAFGLFYVVMAVWVVLAIVVLRRVSTAVKALAWALLLAVLFWSAAIVPSFLFLVTLGTAMWYVGELASVFLATLVVWRTASSLSTAGDRSLFLRRIGLAAGLATALLMLLPIATYFIQDFEVYAIFHPIVFYLPYLSMLVTAAVAATCFALIPTRAPAP